jgi:hypothetical protein
MKFSLINVDKESNGLINGTWLQNHTGTLETAIKKAKETEKVNSNRITVAVVDEVIGVCPIGELFTNMKRLG